MGQEFFVPTQTLIVVFLLNVVPAERMLSADF
jgi:hypothetical protein